MRTLLKRHHARSWFDSVACGAEEMEGECGGESKEGAQRLLCVTTYDSRLLPLWFTAGTHSKGKTTHLREAWR